MVHVLWPAIVCSVNTILSYFPKRVVPIIRYPRSGIRVSSPYIGQRADSRSSTERSCNVASTIAQWEFNEFYVLTTEPTLLAWLYSDYLDSTLALLVLAWHLCVTACINICHHIVLTLARML